MTGMGTDALPLVRISAFLLGGLCLCGSADPATAATYYLSPRGSDANPGTSVSRPRKTFAAALPDLKPGDTLVLLDGIYTKATTGFPSIEGMSGTPEAPGTIKARHERKAFLKGDGTTGVLRLRKCAYWVIEGLRLCGADAKVQWVPSVVDIWHSSNVVLRRLLVHHFNRYHNGGLILLYQTSETLVEESEFYYFHRHAITTKYGQGNVFRRNYFNSRGHGDIEGGRYSGGKDRGDSAVCIYPGSNCLAENNISENNTIGYDIEATHRSVNNRFLGNVSLNDHYGVLLKVRGHTADQMARGTIVRDFLAIRPTYVGVYARAAKETRCVNSTVLGAGISGFSADSPSSHRGDGRPTFFALNCLSLRNKSYGYGISGQTKWSLDHCNAYGNSIDFSPKSAGANLKNVTRKDPGSGDCLVYVPPGSPLKGSGRNGADIGANILYRYQDGELTKVPLWDPRTGAFPHGAIVPGLNDVPGASCFDVHERLHVSRQTLPKDYGKARAGADAPRIRSAPKIRVLQ